MPRLSIIVPLCTSAAAMEQTLVCVLQNRPADCEVIVAHAGDYADPYALHDEVRFVTATRGRAYVNLASAGLRAATAPVVHFLQNGLEVEEGWAALAADLFRDPAVAAAAPVLISPDRRRIAAAGIRYLPSGRFTLCAAGRASDAHLQAPPIQAPDGALLQAGFFRRSALLQLGGLDTTLSPCWASADLAVRLSHAGARAVLAADSLIYQTAASPSLAAGAWRRGRDAERVYRRHGTAVPVWRREPAHTGLILAEAAGAVVHPTQFLTLCGRACGLVDHWRGQQAAQSPIAGGSASTGAPASQVAPAVASSAEAFTSIPGEVGAARSVLHRSDTRPAPHAWKVESRRARIG